MTDRPRNKTTFSYEHISHIRQENEKLKTELDTLKKENDILKNGLEMSNLSTKGSHKTLFKEETDINNDKDDINNPECLKELILQLSQEYDEFKDKYNIILNSLYDKEQTVCDLRERHDSKEEEYKQEISELEQEIIDLNSKIHQYELDIYSAVLYIYYSCRIQMKFLKMRLKE